MDKEEWILVLQFISNNNMAQWSVEDILTLHFFVPIRNSDLFFEANKSGEITEFLKSLSMKLKYTHTYVYECVRIHECRYKFFLVFSFCFFINRVL